MNRTNRSGILDAGPIGGYDQSGTYKIDCRFNKASLIKKISKIAEYKKNVKIYNQDISVFCYITFHVGATKERSLYILILLITKKASAYI